VFLSAVLVACSVYGELTARQSGEYFNVARSLSSGRGFAHPFGDRVGPTAWVAPGYAGLLAGLYLLGDGDRGVVTAALRICHVGVLIGSGVLVLALARRTTWRLGPLVAATAFVLGALASFDRWFQFIDDDWLILLMLDLMLAGFRWLRPPGRWPTAAAWGLFGGVCLLTNPIVGFAWGMLSLVVAVRRRAWSGLAVTALCAGLALTPWTVRNYLVFGRLIPVKSNLAFEMYQSQCLQKDGLLRDFHSHPGGQAGREGQEYRKFGESVYMDRKWQQFGTAVWADPVDYLDRASARVLAATVWYTPFNPKQGAPGSWAGWGRRLAHPLPFLALLLLVCTSLARPLSPPQWAAIGVYALYLLPYAATSYYERYGAPLLAVKVLLVLWAADRLWTWRGFVGK
jgi:hypothetical protein